MPRRIRTPDRVVSFTVDGFHPHEVAQQLDEAADIMVRSGHHCCQPLVESLGLPDGTVRASLAYYNTRQEIDLLVATLEELYAVTPKEHVPVIFITCSHDLLRLPSHNRVRSVHPNGRTNR